MNGKQQGLMTLGILFLSLLLSPLGMCDGEESNSPIPFEFSKTEEGRYQLIWNEQSYSLSVTEDGWVMPTEESLRTFPVHFLPALQLIYVLQEEQSVLTMRRILDRLSRRYPGFMSQQELISYAIEICHLKQDRIHLMELLLMNSLSPEQRGTIHFYLALLETDWLRQKEHLTIALAKLPADENIRFTAQIFSLHIAEAVLSHYLELVRENGIYNQVGMESFRDGVSWWDSYKQIAANTTYLLTVLLTGHEDNLLVLWENQMNQLLELKYAVRELRKAMEEEGVGLQDLIAQREEHSGLRQVSSGISRFIESSFYEEILENGLYEDEVLGEETLPYPSVERLGLVKEIDFVGTDWHTVAIGETNLLNIFMIVPRGGAATVRSLTRTGRLGIIKILRLRPTPALLRAFRLRSALFGILRFRRTFEPVLRRLLPGATGSFVLWLSLETTDGCLIRWYYTGARVWDTLSQEEDQNMRESLTRMILQIRRN